MKPLLGIRSLAGLNRQPLIHLVNITPSKGPFLFAAQAIFTGTLATLRKPKSSHDNRMSFAIIQSIMSDSILYEQRLRH